MRPSLMSAPKCFLYILEIFIWNKEDKTVLYIKVKYLQDQGI